MKNLKALFLAALLFATLLTVLPIYVVAAQETLVWSGYVYSTGALVTGPVLTAGKSYRIDASGIWWYDTVADLEADVQYYETSQNWLSYLPALGGHSFLQVNGMDQNWGPRTPTFAYSITITGTGVAVTLQIIDWVDGNYDNNDCKIWVAIYELPDGEPSGLTPGFWKNCKFDWEIPTGYSPDARFNDVFGVSITIDLGKKNPNSNPTLLEALKAKGGINEEIGIYDALARHAVAALLNAAHPDVDYPMTEGDIISAVQGVIGALWDDAEPLKNQLDAANNLGGGIDAHGNPI